jgi:hypothetical protein
MLSEFSHQVNSNISQSTSDGGFTALDWEEIQSLGWNQLRAYAKAAGVSASGTRASILDALKKIDAATAAYDFEDKKFNLPAYPPEGLTEWQDYKFWIKENLCPKKVWTEKNWGHKKVVASLYEVSYIPAFLAKFKFPHFGEILHINPHKVRFAEISLYKSGDRYQVIISEMVYRFNGWKEVASYIRSNYKPVEKKQYRDLDNGLQSETLVFVFAPESHEAKEMGLESLQGKKGDLLGKFTQTDHIYHHVSPKIKVVRKEPRTEDEPGWVHHINAVEHQVHEWDCRYVPTLTEGYSGHYAVVLSSLVVQAPSREPDAVIDGEFFWVFPTEYKMHHVLYSVIREKANNQVSFHEIIAGDIKTECDCAAYKYGKKCAHVKAYEKLLKPTLKECQVRAQLIQFCRKNGLLRLLVDEEFGTTLKIGYAELKKGNEALIKKLEKLEEIKKGS